MDLEDIVQRVDNLESIESIKKLKSRYMSGCDDCYNPAVLTPMFTKDAVWDGDPYFGRHEGREEIHAFFEEVSQGIVFAIHYAIAPNILVRGDGATGNWYLFMLATSSAGVASWYAGRYEEEYKRESGLWLFSKLTIKLALATRYEDGWHKSPFGAFSE